MRARERKIINSVYCTTKLYTMTDEMDYTTAPCRWSSKDSDIIADYIASKKLGLKNVSNLNDKIEE